MRKVKRMNSLVRLFSAQMVFWTRNARGGANPNAASAIRAVALEMKSKQTISTGIIDFTPATSQPLSISIGGVYLRFFCIMSCCFYIASL